MDKITNQLLVLLPLVFLVSGCTSTLNKYWEQPEMPPYKEDSEVEKLSAMDEDYGEYREVKPPADIIPPAIEHMTKGKIITMGAVIK